MFAFDYELNEKYYNIYSIIVNTKENPIKNYKTLWEFAKENSIQQDFIIYIIEKITKKIWKFLPYLDFIKRSIEENKFYDTITEEMLINNNSFYDLIINAEKHKEEHEIFYKIYNNIKIDDIYIDSNIIINKKTDFSDQKNSGTILYNISKLIKKFGSYNNYNMENNLFSLITIDGETGKELLDTCENKMKYVTPKEENIIQPWIYEYYSNYFKKYGYIYCVLPNYFLEKNKYLIEKVYYRPYMLPIIYKPNSINYYNIIDNLVNDIPVDEKILDVLFDDKHFIKMINNYVTIFPRLNNTIDKYFPSRENYLCLYHYGYCFLNDNLEEFIQLRIDNNQYFEVLIAAKHGAYRIFTYITINSNYTITHDLIENAFIGRNLNIIHYALDKINLSINDCINIAMKTYNWDLFEYFLEKTDNLDDFRLTVATSTRFLKEIPLKIKNIRLLIDFVLINSKNYYSLIYSLNDIY